MTYVGAGMIYSLSLLLGAVLSWGIMWPLISERKGSWFAATLPMSSMRSLNIYKVRVALPLDYFGKGLWLNLALASAPLDLGFATPTVIMVEIGVSGGVSAAPTTAESKR